MLKKILKNQRGLTLVELLAVVVIIGIISAIATVSIGNVIERTREDAIHADALQILSAAELYVAQGGNTDTPINITDAAFRELLPSAGSFEGTGPVTITGEAGNLRLTGAAENGAVRIVFTTASVSMINTSRETRRDVTIANVVDGAVGGSITSSRGLAEEPDNT